MSEQLDLSKIVSRTAKKVIIRIGDIKLALSQEETDSFHALLKKLEEHDKRKG